MTPTPKDIELLKSHNKRIKMTVKLLDSTTYTEIESINGYVISSSCNKTGDSDIRTTCSLSLYIPDKEDIEIDFDKTWNKSMVELSCSLYDLQNESYRTYKIGRMLMVSGNTKYSGNEQQIDLNLVDLMASMTAERGSQIGLETYIPSATGGVNVRNLIIDIIGAFAEFKQNNVCQFDSTLPHDLNFELGIYPIDMLNEILELFPYYEMFYDENGVFTVRKIPTKVGDPVDIGATIIDDLLISVSKTTNFSDIKNTTEIWGKEIQCDYVATECTTASKTYTITINEAFEAYVEGDNYAIIPNANSVSGQKMKIQNLNAYFIYLSNGDGTYTQIPAGEMKNGVPYSVRYTSEKFVLEGELQVRCIVQEIVELPSQAAQSAYKAENACNNVQWVVNPDSPYACRLEPTTGKIIGEIKQVLSGGEFDSIYTTTLAYERGRYENWRKCRLQDTISIEMILVPWMDINYKIQFTSPITNQLETWIVQSIEYDFENWTMTVSASRFYPYYPWD